MPRRIALALSLALTTTLAACKGSDPVTGNPITGGEGRTLASMLPLITTSLTVTTSEAEFGFPDSRTTVAPIVLSYKVEDGKQVSLGFPDLVNTIQFAKLTDKNGGSTDLPIIVK